jgi:hypothetical protein
MWGGNCFLENWQRIGIEPWHWVEGSKVHTKSIFRFSISTFFGTRIAGADHEQLLSLITPLSSYIWGFSPEERGRFEPSLWYLFLGESSFLVSLLSRAGYPVAKCPKSSHSKHLSPYLVCAFRVISTFDLLALSRGLVLPTARVTGRSWVNWVPRFPISWIRVTRRFDLILTDLSNLV